MPDPQHSPQHALAIVRQSLETYEARIDGLTRELAELRDSAAGSDSRERASREAAEQAEARLRQLQDEVEASRLTAAREREQRRALTKELRNAERELARQLAEQAASHQQELQAARDGGDGFRERMTARVLAAEVRVTELEADNADLAARLNRPNAAARRATRRRELIRRLIVELRSRQRAGLALKSGLDAMRQSRQDAEQRQQELQRERRTLEERIVELEATAAEARAQAQPRAAANVDTAELRQRLQAQHELIEVLQRDGEQLKQLKRELRERERGIGLREDRIRELEQELERRDALIEALDQDLEGSRRTRRLQLLPAQAPSTTSPDASRPEHDDTGTVKIRALDPAGPGAEAEGLPDTLADDGITSDTARQRVLERRTD